MGFEPGGSLMRTWMGQALGQVRSAEAEVSAGETPSADAEVPVGEAPSADASVTETPFAFGTFPGSGPGIFGTVTDTIAEPESGPIVGPEPLQTVPTSEPETPADEIQAIIDGQLAGLHNEIQALRDERQGARDEIRELKGQLATLRDADAPKSEIRAVREQIDVLKEQVHHLNEKIDRRVRKLERKLAKELTPEQRQVRVAQLQERLETQESKEGRRSDDLALRLQVLLEFHLEEESEDLVESMIAPDGRLTDGALETFVEFAYAAGTTPGTIHLRGQFLVDALYEFEESRELKDDAIAELRAALNRSIPQPGLSLDDLLFYNPPVEPPSFWTEA